MLFFTHFNVFWIKYDLSVEQTSDLLIKVTANYFRTKKNRTFESSHTHNFIKILFQYIQHMYSYDWERSKEDFDLLEFVTCYLSHNFYRLKKIFEDGDYDLVLAS